MFPHRPPINIAMKPALLCLALMGCVACAAAGLRTEERQEPPVFKFTKGTLADFQNSETVCIRASDLDTDKRTIAKIIEAELARVKSSLAITCAADLPTEIMVDYQASLSVITHSPKRGPLYSFGHVSRRVSVREGWVTARDQTSVENS